MRLLFIGDVVGRSGRAAVIQQAPLLRARWRLDFVIVNLLGRIFMDARDDPFASLDRELAGHPLGNGCQAVVVDMHAEASSEKWALGHFADGRASAVIGTH